MLFLVHPAYHTDTPQILITPHPIYHCESCIISWWDFPTTLPGQLIAWLQGVSELHNQEESFWLCTHALADFTADFWKPVYPYDHKLSGLDACLLIAGHQRCSKRWVVWGEGKSRSSIWVEVRGLVIVREDRLPEFIGEVCKSVGE